MAYCEECSGWFVSSEDCLSREEVERLAEAVAQGETDAALTMLHELLPRLAPLPSLVKRVLADRRAQAPTRVA